MAAMSRLALGPVNTDYYLKVFERFDDTGRTTTTWNWAACLCTLNWMLFRQLWGAALVYVAAAEGLALIVFGVGRSFLHWPVGIELGVLGAFAVLAFAVPGLNGNAILYADIRKRIARALAGSPAAGHPDDPHRPGNRPVAVRRPGDGTLPALRRPRRCGAVSGPLPACAGRADGN